MGKKDETFSKKVLEMVDAEDKKVRKEISVFHMEDEPVKTIPLSEQNPFGNIISNIRKDSTTQMLTVEQMEEKCHEIRENVIQGKPNNVEIDFINGEHKTDGKEHSLGNTVIKAVEFDSHVATYLYYKKEDVTNALVFIGGKDAQAFLLIKDNKGDITCTRLSEFHLLSISGTEPKKEVGIITSYVWENAKVYSSLVLASTNLDPIKNLLLAEGIRAKVSKDEPTLALKDGDKDE